MKKSSKQVPVGVKIISILYYIGAVISLISGIALIAGGSFLSGLYGGLFTGLAVVAGIFMIALAVLGFFVGRGLWKGQQWARVVAIILAILGIISAISSLVQGAWSSIVGLIIQIVIGGYLWFSKEVKKAFA